MNKLWVYFRLSDLVENATNLIDNLCMKPGDKIATYNMEFMQYTDGDQRELITKQKW